MKTPHRFSDRMMAGLGIACIVLGLIVGAVTPPVVQAANELVHINEVMAGVNGISAIQFIEMEVSTGAQKEWGPQGSETVGRAMLVFFDSAENQTGRYVFPDDPGGTANTVLIATQAFADWPGAPTPDFIITPEVMALSGKVCFKNNPANANADPINLCLSYGSFTGNTEGAGTPADELPIVNVTSLERFANLTAFGAASNSNADFALVTNPDPTNASGQTLSVPFSVASFVEQGENLFILETFNGNGRTCGTCHRPEDSFMLKPEAVAQMPRTDPLFIANFNLNTLVLNANAQPSDLRGVITATNGVTATVLAGKAALTYLVYGGSGMTGSVVDASGNTGTLQSLTLGDLNSLEDPVLLEGGRALITANIDGFTEPAVMRKTPHLLNMAFTEPFGLSGEFTGTAPIQAFSTAAVRQHASRSLARVEGTDFRLPTSAELVALEAFQLSLFMPADQNFDLDRFATTESQKRGRDLFLRRPGTGGSGGFNCSICHEDGTGAFAGVLSGKINFQTNVQQLAINGNQGDNLPRDPAVGELRDFNTSPLFGVKHTAPYFHDNAIATLRDAVLFYNSSEFQNGPSGFLIDPVSFDNPQNVDDLVAFLESLVETPFVVGPGSPAAIAFGNQQVAAGLSPSQIATITNTAAEPITITGSLLNGSSPNSFVITAFAPATVFGQNESRTISVAFDPSATGLVTATLEITLTSATETWAYGVALSGNGITSPPTIANLANLTINANSSTGALPFTIGDLDTASTSLTVTGSSSNLTLVPNANIVLGGSGANRTVVITPVTNESGSATITILVSDGVDTASDSFVLTVNAFPVITNVAAQSTNEDTAAGTIPVTVNDAETSAGALTVSASSSNPALVPDANIVVGGSGNERTVTATPIANQNGSATITISVSDGLATTTDTFVLTVNAVNDAPSFTPGANQSILEDVDAQTVPGWATALSRGPADEASQTLGFIVTNDNPSLFSTQPAVAPNGALTFAPAPNANGDATITVTLHDSGGTANGGQEASAPVNFIITVTPVNDAPSFTPGANLAVLEDEDAQTVWATALSPGPADEAGQTLSFIVTNDNPALFSTQPALAPDGTLTFIPVPNANGNATITVSLHDDGGTANDGQDASAPVNFTVTVTPVNDAPTISDIADQTTNANTPLTSITVSIDDVDVGDALIVLGSSSNPALVSDTDIVFEGNGVTRTMTIMPVADQAGNAVITVLVSDGTLTASDTFTLTVIQTSFKLYLPVMFMGEVNASSCHTNCSPAIPAGARPSKPHRDWQKSR